MSSSSIIADEVLTITEVSQLSKVSVRKIYYLIQKNIFPKPTKVGRSNRWLASTIFDYLRTGQIQEVEQ